MTLVKAFIRTHPALTYFALTFAISWGGLLAVGGLVGMAGATWQSDPRLPFMAVAMLAGPSIAGILLTTLVSGRAGLRELLSRLLRWRVGARWYAVALLTAPLVLTAVRLALSFASPVFLPSIVIMSDTASLLLFSIAGALAVGVFEELGWTGFAIPRLRPHYSAFVTGLIVGVPWGAWHLVTNDIWIAGTYAGGLPWAVFVIVNGVSLVVGGLPAYRVLMVWVYDRTGSLLVAMLMHASLTGGLAMILMPLAISVVPNLIWYLVLTAALWVVVAAVAVANRGQLSQQPLRG